jgi:hypothetical protein
LFRCAAAAKYGLDRELFAPFGEVAERLKAPHSKFGDGDNFADHPVQIRLNKWVIFERRRLSNAALSRLVLSSSVAKW